MATNPNRRATRSEALDDLFITTLDNRRAGIVDVTFHKNPFFFWLSSKGKMDGRPGGREIVIDLEVGENDTVKSFGKGETFSLAEQEIFTEAHYPWKQIGGSLVRYATDDAKNAGRSAYIRMAETRVKNLEKSIRKELETQLMGDGTGNNSKDINGLQKLVNAAGTGTVGEINSGTYTWWETPLVQPVFTSFLTSVICSSQSVEMTRSLLTSTSQIKSPTSSTTTKPWNRKTSLTRLLLMLTLSTLSSEGHRLSTRPFAPLATGTCLTLNTFSLSTTRS